MVLRLNSKRSFQKLLATRDMELIFENQMAICAFDPKGSITGICKLDRHIKDGWIFCLDEKAPYHFHIEKETEIGNELALGGYAVYTARDVMVCSQCNEPVPEDVKNFIFLVTKLKDF